MNINDVIQWMTDAANIDNRLFTLETQGSDYLIVASFDFPNPVYEFSPSLVSSIGRSGTLISFNYSSGVSVTINPLSPTPQTTINNQSYSVKRNDVPEVPKIPNNNGYPASDD